jgi:hypothetical protein
MRWSNKCGFAAVHELAIGPLLPSPTRIRHGSYQGIAAVQLSESTALLGIPDAGLCTHIRVFDEVFEVVRVCAFMLDAERFWSSLAAVSAISFFTIARPNEL